MFYSRRIYPSLKKALTSKEITVITGMRRTGKTTLMKMLYDEIKSENKVFLDLENIINQRMFEEIDFSNIWNNLSAYNIDYKRKVYIFIDEIQLMPGIVKPIKYLYDHFNVKFIVSGSSSFYLKNLFPESLAGRKIIFELYPLDFGEFLLFKGIDKPVENSFELKVKKKNVVLYEQLKNYMEEYIEFGGFPQVVLKKSSKEKLKSLTDIFSSYYEKDIMMISDFKNLNVFRDMMFLLLERVGSKIDITEISRLMNISRETVYSYLSFLEGTYFLSLVKPYSKNTDREVSGARKLYICDNGFLTNFAKVSDGSLFENAVFLNLRKYGKLNYYQRRTGAEIDFILDKQTAFKIKSKADEHDEKNLVKLSIEVGLKKYYIVSRKFVDVKKSLTLVDL